MNDPKIKVKIKHSESKAAWNIVGTTLGRKYKIATVPYVPTATMESKKSWSEAEAFIHAEFIEYCFNNSTAIIEAEKRIQELEDKIKLINALSISKNLEAIYQETSDLTPQK